MVNETGLYASFWAMLTELKVGVGNRTYSAYYPVQNVSYSGPAPFSHRQMLQEGYPISYIIDELGGCSVHFGAVMSEIG